jgi:chitinase
MTTIQKNEPALKLAGNFQASGTPFLSNLSLANVPGYYNSINITYAVLDENALLNFNPYAMAMNIPMVKEVRTEKNVTVLLSIGGENGNFNFLDRDGKVNNFYNSLAEHYINWGFDGITFDIRQLSPANLPYIVKAIQWFHESYPKAILKFLPIKTLPVPVP